MTDAVADVERAMIAIRRSQQRRALSRIGKARGQGAHDPVHELLDVVEELAERGEASTVTALSTVRTPSSGSSWTSALSSLTTSGRTAASRDRLDQPAPTSSRATRQPSER